jgi:hypothetical protein
VTEELGERPNVPEELARLKDFQRLSVEYAYKRLYGTEDPTRRFLVADEVGLGKTLVARGIIAKTIDALWDKVPRIDIVYVCSNAEIARQNIARLTPRGATNVTMASRITLLPLQAHNLRERRVNVIALTPKTSLDLRQSLGVMRERALLLSMLLDHWGLDRTAATRLFSGTATLANFRRYMKWFEAEESIDPELCQAFLDQLEATCVQQRADGETTLKNRLLALTAAYSDDAKGSREQQTARNKLVGELRHLLASSCIRALQPDLIILDEFQRFKELLSGDSPAAEMARQLFAYDDGVTQTRVLLLSATPYKMYTIHDEVDDEDHYADFLRTVRFLFTDSPQKADELAVLLKEYRLAIYGIGAGGEHSLATIRDGIEGILRKVMVRTERLAITPDRSGMLTERPTPAVDVRVRDARSYLQFQSIARQIEHPDTMEFWKASPWLLNFMDEYKLKCDFDRETDETDQSKELASAIGKANDALLDMEQVKQFANLDAPHGRMRWLTDHMLQDGLWRVLWMPPALPYHSLGAPFKDVAMSSPTKALVFSAWRVVPRALAAALSHEAERRMYRDFLGETVSLEDAPERLGDLLQPKRKEGRAAGLTVLPLLYPSQYFAAKCDPRDIAAGIASKVGRAPTPEEMIAEAERRIRSNLEAITQTKPERATPDESWYWAAPVLLDAAHDRLATAEWLERDLASFWSAGANPIRRVESDEEEGTDDSIDVDSDGSALSDLVDRLRRVLGNGAPKGIPPRDLLRVMALTALASPATVALRTLGRITSSDALSDPEARDAAARVAAGFRSLFNQPDSTAVIRASTGVGDYWKECLEYANNGALQAVMDEYAHLLVSEVGAFGQTPSALYLRVANAIASASAIRRASVGVHGFTARGGRIVRERHKMRSRFAMRYGEETADAEGERVRADDVRRAFNSPFWPFVLATTSVGQEGLDFHLYCHAVVHWNLPPNPVDLEQREGRVHRYKGHAVRKNVASRHSEVWKRRLAGDPWEDTFNAARDSRAGNENDLVPYWVYPVAGGSTIDRYVPMFPLSRDVERFRRLRESLALYRMVFGQPRQEELLAYLSRVVSPDRIQELATRLQISLAP